VSYALVDVEVTGAPSPIRLGPGEEGVGLVSRRRGRPVGFALHELSPGTTLEPDQVAALLDPAPSTEPDPDPAAPAPSVTVVICTRDRPELLARCLEGLAAQNPPPDEVLVIDNAPSDDSTAKLCAERGARHVEEPCPGLDFARNRALREATGEVLAFLDDDVVPDAGWLQGVRAVWRDHPDAGAMTGQVLPYELVTPSQIAFEHRGGFRGGNAQVRYDGLDRPGDPVYPYGPGMFGAGCNMAVRRDVARRLGGFDEALDTGPPLPGGGDIDLFHRVVREGWPLVYEPRAVVFHRHRRDDAALRRQYDSWGRSLMAWAAKTYRRDPAGRPKLRLLLRWWFPTQLHQAWSSARGREAERRDAALAELRGGVGGLLGTYGRSRRRSARLRRTRGEPTVAILPWGDLVEDYLDPLGRTLDDYAERLSGGWLFGYAEALRSTGVGTVIVCWSRAVDRPTRRIHAPTGAVLWFLPPSRAYVAARARLRDPYAWTTRAALRPGRPTLGGWLGRAVAPFFTATPVALARVLRQEGCRAVLCQEYEEGRFDVTVALGCVLRLPVLATFQGGDHTRTPLERLVRRASVRAAAGLLVGAEGEAERVVRRYGVPPERVAAVPNPLDPATVRRIPTAEARAALDLPAERPVVVWVGRVDIHPKGIDVLLDAWEQVRADPTTGGPTLLLLGTGSGAGWLHEQLAARRLDDVHWRDEYVLDRDVVGTYLSAGDVFVLPSRQEGFPVAPVEAMAAGLPVVACDAPGVRAVVGEGPEAGGVVVPREDPAALARGLVRFLADTDLAESVGAIARRRAEATFSLEAVGAQLRALLVDR
jgi:glycosyltransferase involved in cell wall biosynthesis/GT2 family glycosyltransferase